MSLFRRVREFKALEKEAVGHCAEIRELKEEVADLKLKRKIEDEDIRHMVKIKEEQLNLEHEKRALELQRESDKEVSGVKDAYRDKLEGFLKNQVKDVKEMYGQILQRLPDVNVQLNKDLD